MDDELFLATLAESNVGAAVKQIAWGKDKAMSTKLPDASGTSIHWASDEIAEL